MLAALWSAVVKVKVKVKVGAWLNRFRFALGPEALSVDSRW